MPPIRKGTRNPHQWTCGGVREISHLQLIAHGGFGEVHKMLDGSTFEVFARKIIRPLGDKVTPEDIDNEAKAVSTLCSPGQCNYVVEVLKHGWLPRQPGAYFIDMEYCEESLAKRIQRGFQRGFRIVTKPKPIEGDSLRSESEMIVWTELDWRSVVAIALDITAGLIHVHEHGTAHRDLKPQNVLFSRRNNCWKLADFGTASQASSKRLNTTRYSRGTSGYRAPETLAQPDSRYNQKSDIFALGCILYEMMTGAKLFLDDFTIFSYSTTRLFPHTIWWPISPDPDLFADPLHPLEMLDAVMLNIDPQMRPKARDVHRLLGVIRAGTERLPGFPRPYNVNQDRELQRYTSLWIPGFNIAEDYSGPNRLSP